jgi:hypothetical protein
MKSIWESMIVDRTKQMYDPDGDGPLGLQPMSNTTDPFENIFGNGSYLGGYHLNIMNTFDPVKAAQFTDSLYAKGGSWATDVNMATNYYVSNSTITYGVPAKDITQALLRVRCIKTFRAKLHIYFTIHPNRT